MNQDYEVVFIAQGQLEAEMIRLFFEASGLHPIINQESAGIAYGFTIGRMGEVKILVPQNELDDAKKLFDAMDSGELENQTFTITGDSSDDDISPVDDEEGLNSEKD